MVKPNLIVRTNRRSLSITVDKNAELIVRAPRRMSLEDILSFIKQKEQWIVSKQKQIIAGLQKNKKIIDYDSFLFCGKEYKKTYIAKQKNIELSDTSLIVPEGCDSCKELLLIKKWYASMTKEILQLRVNYFADLMQINFLGVGIDNCKTRWGSCSKSGMLKFNIRLSMLPHKIIDYIIIHELSHLIEFNHSKQFYNIIGSIMPDWQTQRKKLKDYGYLLSLLR